MNRSECFRFVIVYESWTITMLDIQVHYLYYTLENSLGEVLFIATPAHRKAGKLVYTLDPAAS